MTAAGTILVYVGTYTEAAQKGKAEGIYVYRMDGSSGALTQVRTIAGGPNPSFLAFDPARRFLFAVNETETFAGQSGGGASAFALDAGTGDLTLLNAQPTHGAYPCHLCTDPTGRYLLSANYGSGSYAVHPIGADGRLGTATDVVQHKGSGPNARRQDGPHAHMVTFDRSGHYALLVDLGIDKTLVYRMDIGTGKLDPHRVVGASGAVEQATARAEPGAGPRHVAFHTSNRYVYIINEIGCTIDAFAWDANAGTPAPLQTISTLPVGFTGANTTAEIAVHPSGRFLYGSNRGHDSIAMYLIDSSSGMLTALGNEPTGGKEPRSFAIDPTGTFLLAANQNSSTIVTFRIDQSTGALAATGESAQVPTPVCVLFG
jgi:6-phosphogluconolactonase